MDVKLINGGIIIAVPVYETRSLKSQGRVTEGSGQLRPRQAKDEAIGKDGKEGGQAGGKGGTVSGLTSNLAVTWTRPRLREEGGRGRGCSRGVAQRAIFHR